MSFIVYIREILIENLSIRCLYRHFIVTQTSSNDLSNLSFLTVYSFQFHFISNNSANKNMSRRGSSYFQYLKDTSIPIPYTTAVDRYRQLQVCKIVFYFTLLNLYYNFNYKASF